MHLPNIHHKEIKTESVTCRQIMCQLLIFHSWIRSKEIVHTILSVVLVCITIAHCWNQERQRIRTVSSFDSHIFSHSNRHTPTPPTSSYHISSCMLHRLARLPLCWWSVCLADFPLSGLKKCGSLEALKGHSNSEWEKLNMGRHEQGAKVQSCGCLSGYVCVCICISAFCWVCMKCFRQQQTFPSPCKVV